MPLSIWLNIEIVDDTVKPAVSIASRQNFNTATPRPDSTLAEVRLATEVANRVLDFAHQVEK